MVGDCGASRDAARHLGKLNAELNRILQTPEIKSFMANEGADPMPSTPETFARHLADELQRWTALVDRTGLKVQ
jgi:tripartite-type tricarboxylate transporter receptor subunit TctC